MADCVHGIDTRGQRCRAAMEYHQLGAALMILPYAGQAGYTGTTFYVDELKDV